MIASADVAAELKSQAISAACIQRDSTGKTAITTAGAVLRDRARSYNEPSKITITKFDGTTETLTNTGGTNQNT